MPPWEESKISQWNTNVDVLKQPWEIFMKWILQWVFLWWALHTSWTSLHHLVHCRDEWDLSLPPLHTICYYFWHHANNSNSSWLIIFWLSSWLFLSQHPVWFDQNFVHWIIWYVSASLTNAHVKCQTKFHLKPWCICQFFPFPLISLSNNDSKYGIMVIAR